MSLHDAIGEMNSIFFDADGGFAESVTYLPQGSTEDQFTLDAVVDWGDEEGNNQVRGEGRATLNQDRGRTTRGSVVVELPTTRTNDDGDVVNVVVNENGRDRIHVTKHGSGVVTKLSVKRIVARDEAAQAVLCHTETEHAAQPRKTRFG